MKVNLKSKTTYVVGAIVLLGIALTLFYRSYEKHHRPVESAISVAISKTAMLDYAPKINVIGTVVSGEGINVSSKDNGIVNSIYFKSGENVKKGQLLVILDNTDIKAELAQNTAKYKLAQQNFARYKKLLKAHIVSHAVFDTYQSQLEATKATVAYEQALLAETIIRAPFDGRVGIRKISVGQYISAGQVLVNLQSLKHLYVDFSIPEQFVNLIQVSTPVTLSSEALKKQMISGEITALGSQLDAGTRALPVRAKISREQSAKIFPGMYVQVNVNIGKTVKGITVPQSAIAYGPLGEYVYIVKNKRAFQKKVITGDVVNGSIIVKQGLQAGDVVVCAGQGKLHQGALVQTSQFKDAGEA